MEGFENENDAAKSVDMGTEMDGAEDDKDGQEENGDTSDGPDEQASRRLLNSQKRSHQHLRHKLKRQHKKLHALRHHREIVSKLVLFNWGYSACCEFSHTSSITWNILISL